MSDSVGGPGSFVGAAIREFRKRKRVSQEELAAALDSSRNSVSNWERGVHPPPAETIAAIARALRVSVSDIEGLAVSMEQSADNRSGGRSAFRAAPRIPPRAYQLVFDYCKRLESAGVEEDVIEEARRLMSGETFNTLRKHMADERTEAGWVKDVKAAWAFIKDSLKAQGYEL